MNVSNKKNAAKSKILSYMLTKESTSKVELAKELNLSMPTVLSNVNDLIRQNLIGEVGELESTGGRKARSIAIKKDYCYAVGVDITANHVGMVMINLAGEVICHDRRRLSFETSMKYYTVLSEMLEAFLEQAGKNKNVLGVGFSLPGIIQGEERILVKSHVLHLENYSLKMFEQVSRLPVYFENDANASMLAEGGKAKDAIYLSLNHTLGGAICINGSLFSGQNYKAAEFGHMVLVPGGKTCYCGKKGCADAYCAASVLTDNGKISIEEYFAERRKQDADDSKWNDYLDKLAILISNLRMAYDTDIILGGDVGGYLGEYHMELGERIFQYNLFDDDLSYLGYCTYKKEAAAVGVAKHFFEEFINEI